MKLSLELTETVSALALTLATPLAVDFQFGLGGGGNGFLGSVFYADEYIAKAGGTPGVGDNGPALLAAHEDFCAAGDYATLIYSSPRYTTSETLPLPNASFWSMKSIGMSEITCLGDNMPIVRMLADLYREYFTIEGFAFGYTNQQVVDRDPDTALYSEAPGSNVRSAAIVLGASQPNIYGVYEFTLRRILFKNCFRGVDKGWDEFKAGNINPWWGCTFEDITAFPECTGAAIFQDEPFPGGSPRFTVRQFYGKSSAGGANREPILVLKFLDNLYMEQIEFNDTTGLVALIESRNTLINNLRFEIVSWPIAFGTMISFSTGRAVINNLSVQNWNLLTDYQASVVNAFGADVTINGVSTAYAGGEDSSGINDLTAYPNAVCMLTSAQTHEESGEVGRVQINGPWNRQAEGKMFLSNTDTNGPNMTFGSRLQYQFVADVIPSPNENAEDALSVSFKTLSGDPVYIMPINGWVTKISVDFYDGETGEPVEIEAGEVRTRLLLDGKQFFGPVGAETGALGATSIIGESSSVSYITAAKWRNVDPDQSHEVFRGSRLGALMQTNSALLPVTLRAVVTAEISEFAHRKLAA